MRLIPKKRKREFLLEPLVEGPHRRKKRTNHDAVESTILITPRAMKQYSIFNNDEIQIAPWAKSDKNLTLFQSRRKREKGEPVALHFLGVRRRGEPDRTRKERNHHELISFTSNKGDSRANLDWTKLDDSQSSMSFHQVIKSTQSVGSGPANSHMDSSIWEESINFGDDFGLDSPKKSRRNEDTAALQQRLKSLAEEAASMRQLSKDFLQSSIGNLSLSSDPGGEVDSSEESSQDEKRNSIGSNPDPPTIPPVLRERKSKGILKVRTAETKLEQDLPPPTMESTMRAFLLARGKYEEKRAPPKVIEISDVSGQTQDIEHSTQINDDKYGHINVPQDVSHSELGHISEEEELKCQQWIVLASGVLAVLGCGILLAMLAWQWMVNIERVVHHLSDATRQKGRELYIFFSPYALQMYYNLGGFAKEVFLVGGFFSLICVSQMAWGKVYAPNVATNESQPEESSDINLKGSEITPQGPPQLIGHSGVNSPDNSISRKANDSSDETMWSDQRRSVPRGAIYSENGTNGDDGESVSDNSFDDREIAKHGESPCQPLHFPLSVYRQLPAGESSQEMSKKIKAAMLMSDATERNPQEVAQLIISQSVEAEANNMESEIVSEINLPYVSIMSSNTEPNSWIEPTLPKAAEQRLRDCTSETMDSNDDSNTNAVHSMNAEPVQNVDISCIGSLVVDSTNSNENEAPVTEAIKSENNDSAIVEGPATDIIHSEIMRSPSKLVCKVEPDHEESQSSGSRDSETDDKIADEYGHHRVLSQYEVIRNRALGPTLNDEGSNQDGTATSYQADLFLITNEAVTVAETETGDSSEPVVLLDGGKDGDSNLIHDNFTSAGTVDDIDISAGLANAEGRQVIDPTVTHHVESATFSLEHLTIGEIDSKTEGATVKDNESSLQHETVGTVDWVVSAQSDRLDKIDSSDTNSVPIAEGELMIGTEAADNDHMDCKHMTLTSRGEFIEHEISSIIHQVEEEMGDKMEPEAVQALQKAAFEVAYRKQYYDLQDDKMIYLLPVANTILNYSLMVAAEKYYDKEEEFPAEYVTALLNIARMKIDDDEIDYEYIETLAIDCVDDAEKECPPTETAGTESAELTVPFRAPASFTLNAPDSPVELIEGSVGQVANHAETADTDKDDLSAKSVSANNSECPVDKEDQDESAEDFCTLSRLDLIEKEISSIIMETEEDELGEVMETEAVQALKRAALEVAYKKQYYDVLTDKVIYLLPVANTILDYSLIEVAEKYYYDEEDLFPVEYVAALRSVADMRIVADDIDYEYIGMLAGDVSIN